VERPTPGGATAPSRVRPLLRDWMKVKARIIIASRAATGAATAATGEVRVSIVADWGQDSVAGSSGKQNWHASIIQSNPSAIRSQLKPRCLAAAITPTPRLAWVCFCHMPSECKQLLLLLLM
jgi:hypothetical protein